LKYYFLLQSKRIHRHLKDFGIEPIIGYVVIIVLFYLLSSFLFENVMHANYIYLCISSLFVYGTNAAENRTFIKLHFSVTDYQKITILNAILKVTPFAIFLIYKGNYIEILLVYTIACCVSFIRKRGKISLTIPTPFSNKPHEFIIGFRKTCWIFLLNYGLAIIAVYVDNFNLAIFSMLSVFFVCASYYMKKDPEFYIWVYTMNPKEFLRYKIRIAFICSFIVLFPVFLILLIFYLNQLHIILLFYILGFLYMGMYILIKYAFQNQGVEIFQGIIGMLCLLFPPIMIIAIPYFYTKAKNNLELLLR